MSKNKKLTVPIRSTDIDDPFCRYKMPSIEVIGKQKGCYGETFLTNIADVAKALKMPVLVLAKSIAADLNTILTVSGTDIRLKGVFSAEDVMKRALRPFIDTYVLCGQCDLPELTYSVDETGLLVTCRACNWMRRCSKKRYKDDRVYKQMSTLLTPSIKKTKTVDELLDVPYIDEEKEVQWETDVSAEATQERLNNAIGNSIVMKNLLQ